MRRKWEKKKKPSKPMFAWVLWMWKWLEPSKRTCQNPWGRFEPSFHDSWLITKKKKRIFFRSLSYPLDLIRCRLTAQGSTIRYNGITHAFFVILREEGALGLFKGLVPSLCGIAPYVALNFTLFENGLKGFRREKKQKETTENIFFCFLVRPFLFSPIPI